MVRVVDFFFIVGNSYEMGSDEVLRTYVPDYEFHSILVEAHGDFAEGHYVGRETVQNILREGIWWPTTHKDSKDYCRECDVYQRIGRPSRRDELPLNPQVRCKPSISEQ